MTAPVDFTACPRVPGRAYNGANGKKICVAFEGARWMLKFPPPARASSRASTPPPSRVLSPGPRISPTFSATSTRPTSPPAPKNSSMSTPKADNP